MNFKKYLEVHKPKSKIWNITYNMSHKQTLEIPLIDYFPNTGKAYRDIHNTIHYLFLIQDTLYIFQNTESVGKTEYTLVSITDPYSLVELLSKETRPT